MQFAKDIVIISILIIPSLNDLAGLSHHSFVDFEIRSTVVVRVKSDNDLSAIEDNFITES